MSKSSYFTVSVKMSKSMHYRVSVKLKVLYNVCEILDTI